MKLLQDSFIYAFLILCLACQPKSPDFTGADKMNIIFHELDSLQKESKYIESTVLLFQLLNETSGDRQNEEIIEKRLAQLNEVMANDLLQKAKDHLSREAFTDSLETLELLLAVFPDTESGIHALKLQDKIQSTALNYGTFSK